MPDTPIQAVAVIGGGPAGLMAAEIVARAGHAVTIYDRMPTLGRKMLMAGRGGLNLTHGEPLETLLRRYGACADRLGPAIRAFPPSDLIAWCNALGEETFVGSSGRVFPRRLKASPLLRAWLAALAARGVVAQPRHRFSGWTAAGALRFETPDGSREAMPAATVLACGGASWPRLGSDGGWTATLPQVSIRPLRPSNCGFAVAWSERFAARFAGQPLKRIAVSFVGVTVPAVTARGEAMITAAGIEGGAMYALSAALREACPATVSIDLRPDLGAEELARRLDGPRGSQSLSNFLRKAAGLPPVAIGLVQEALHGPGGDAAGGDLATLIKALPLRLEAPFGLERAISTAGGIDWEELDEHLMLRRLPGVFAAGEMLDWEAPTGGYLLQACFSTGAAAGRGVVEWLASKA